MRERVVTLLAPALLAPALLVAACRRAAPAPHRRCLELVDALPRLEAEERAWPRPESLACDEHGEARAREIARLRAEMDDVCAWLPAEARAPALEAAGEVERCAACTPDHTAHCARARELLAEVELALSLADAGIR